MVTYFCEKCNISASQSTCSVCEERTKGESRLFWCTTCNIPTYAAKCSLCQGVCGDFTTDARPVFPEERLLLEILLGKPLAFSHSSVWNGVGNRYYVDGKRIKITMIDFFAQDRDHIRVLLEEYAPQNNYDYFDEMIARWTQANQTHFHYITTEAKQYIQERSKNYWTEEKKNAFVSFSGGKDSTVVSDLVRKALSTPSIIHIFGNTTLEFPSTYEYIQRFKAEHRRTPLLTSQNKEQNFFDLCETIGPPSRALRWCCTYFKTGFIGEKVEKTFKNTPSVLTFYGIRRSESASRSQYERSSTGKKITQQLVSSPIIDWYDYDIWLYLLTVKIDFNDAYRLGFARVGCWCCPNNSQWAQFLSEIYMPEDSSHFYDILLRFAKKMKKDDPEDYVKSGGWKSRQGGAGIERSKDVPIDFKPCAVDEYSFQYVLNRPITEELYELFKPFGKLDFNMGKSRLGEVFVLCPKSGLPLFKLQGRLGERELRITILNTPIANRTKIVEVELKFKCQISKFQLCAGCHACETVCRHHAIKLEKNGSDDTDYRYQILESKCVHCYECINHFTGGCYMRRVLHPRGKGYDEKVKKSKTERQ